MKAKNQKASDFIKRLESSFNLGECPVVGNYALFDKIGEGTYGVVRLGIHIPTNQKVAVKIINKSFGPLVVGEVESWRHLRHPHIIQLYEVLVTETKIYLVMEYASCGEVFDHICLGKTKEKEAQKIFSQLVFAIDYCHGKGYVHRDLKPENLLFDADWNLKVVDFGFTTHFENGKLLDSFCGSARYISPEIIRKQKYSGPESDIWSMGIILFTLLCGRFPFETESENESEMFQKILNLDYKIDDSCSKDAKDLVNKILKIDPRERAKTSDILKHPWLSNYLKENKVQDLQRKGYEIKIDSLENEELLYQLSLSGFDIKQIKLSVKENTPDQLSAMFFLLKNSRKGTASETLNPLSMKNGETLSVIN